MCAFIDGDVLQFFDGHRDALPLYERLMDRIMARIPETRIKVCKTQISLSTRYNYAAVSFMPCRRAADRPATWLTVTFGLNYQMISPRIDVSVEPYPNRWTHHVMIGSAEEIDETLMSWLAEAAAFASRKGR